MYSRVLLYEGRYTLPLRAAYGLGVMARNRLGVIAGKRLGVMERNRLGVMGPMEPLRVGSLHVRIKIRYMRQIRVEYTLK